MECCNNCSLAESVYCGAFIYIHSRHSTVPFSQNYVGYWVAESNADFTLSEDSLSSCLKQYNSPQLLRFQPQNTGPSGETAGL